MGVEVHSVLNYYINIFGECSAHFLFEDDEINFIVHSLVKIIDVEPVFSVNATGWNGLI